MTEESTICQILGYEKEDASKGVEIAKGLSREKADVEFRKAVDSGEHKIVELVTTRVTVQRSRGAEKKPAAKS